MNLGENLFNLRKEKGLSQEEVAEKLNVTRQTVSKWETNQSTPDFDKIIPICELYGITTEELLQGKRFEKSFNEMSTNDIKRKRAAGIGIGVLIYFISIVWIMISIPVFRINPVLASAIFLLICGVATFVMIYTCIVYKKEKKEEQQKEYKLRKQIEDILSIFFVIIYLAVSFLTMAWHITWVLFLVYGLICEILKLIFMLKENKEIEVEKDVVEDGGEQNEEQ